MFTFDQVIQKIKVGHFFMAQSVYGCSYTHTSIYIHQHTYVYKLMHNYLTVAILTFYRRKSN